MKIKQNELLHLFICALLENDSTFMLFLLILLVKMRNFFFSRKHESWKVFVFLGKHRRRKRIFNHIQFFLIAQSFSCVLCRLLRNKVFFYFCLILCLILFYWTGCGYVLSKLRLGKISGLIINNVYQEM